MTTMNVLDSVGGTIAVEKPLTPGQAAMAASRPVVIASDQTALPVASHPVTNAGTFAVQSTVQAGSAIMGKVGIDQTTPGTTNGVQVNAALPAGTAIVGKFGIDQTTDGTTNAVHLVAGTALVGTVKIGDGTNNAAIKAASTPALATDPALVVSISPNSSGSVAQGSTTSGQTGALIQGAVTTAAPAYTTAQTSPLSLDTAGNLRVGAQIGVTATANGSTASRVNAAASTNATSLKASAGQLYTIDVFDVAAYNVFLKLYNKASAPTVGTDVPVMTIPVQAGGGYSKTWPMGLPFATGIAYAITKFQADSDTTVVVAGDLTGNMTWI